MKIPTLLKSALSSLFVTMLCTAGNAYSLVIDEVEPNTVQPDAQPLVLPTGAAEVAGVHGAVGAFTSDDDFYAFDAQMDDVLVIKVISDGTGWDSNVALYDSLGQLVAQNDDAPVQDPQSLVPWDSRIDYRVVGNPGKYYVVVTNANRFALDNFTMPSTTVTGMGGGYKLAIAGATPSTDPAGSEDPYPPSDDPGTVPSDDDTAVDENGVLTIGMDIKNWRGQDADVGKSWHRHAKRWGKRRGKRIDPLPVVMYSSNDFDAKTIDKESLTFGATGEEESMFRCSRRMRDFNGDGMRDMMCFFDGYKTGFEEGDVEGFLFGTTKDGQAFKARATLRDYTLPSRKSRTWHERHHRDPHADDGHHRGNHKRHHRRHRHSRR